MIADSAMAGTLADIARPLLQMAERLNGKRDTSNLLKAYGLIKSEIADHAGISASDAPFIDEALRKWRLG